MSTDVDDGEWLWLYDADPQCEHEIVTKWSGVECGKCKGWFCF